MSNFLNGKLISYGCFGEGGALDIHVDSVRIRTSLSRHAVQDWQDIVLGKFTPQLIIGRLLSLHCLRHSGLKIEVTGFVVRCIGIGNIGREQFESLAIKRKSVFPKSFIACPGAFNRVHKYLTNIALESKKSVLMVSQTSSWHSLEVRGVSVLPQRMVQVVVVK